MGPLSLAPVVGEGSLFGGVFTVGINGERDLGLRYAGERDRERDLDRELDLDWSLDGDLLNR